jgi:ParB family transcriptional regulator, chromosome partitioning protein
MTKVTIKAIKDIPLADLVIGKGQVRVKDVGKELDELAESIQVMGLLEPIVVAPADKLGKYEILTGQRRYLAHKQLKMPTIAAAILSEKVDESMAKAISVTENLVRRDISQKEKIDACTALYKKYGSFAAVRDATGLNYDTVRQYVKYDRLVPQLKKLVDEGAVDVKVALRAQDAASVTGTTNAKDAVKLAKEMSGMSGVQQQRIVEDRESNPDTPVDDVIEGAKTGAKITQIVVTLSAEAHRSLQAFAKSEGQNQDDAAATLIQEALEQKGF